MRSLRRPAVPLGPLSIYDPVYLGIDEDGGPVRLPMMYRNLLAGGEPGSGKSGALNNIVAHGALALDCRLWLMDGKRVELGQWRPCAEVFVGPSLDEAVDRLSELQGEMDRRYDLLDTKTRRKIVPGDGLDAIMLVADELAYYSALLRDVVARGRAAGVIAVVATQRPSHDIIPTSLRDLFGYRLAFRCTTDTSSDIVLGHGWAARGYDASTIDPATPGVAYLLAEGGVPRRIRCAWLSDVDIADIVGRAA